MLEVFYWHIPLQFYKCVVFSAIVTAVSTSTSPFSCTSTGNSTCNSTCTSLSNFACTSISSCTSISTSSSFTLVSRGTGQQSGYDPLKVNVL